MDANWDGCVDLMEYVKYVSLEQVREFREDFEAAVGGIVIANEPAAPPSNDSVS